MARTAPNQTMLLAAFAEKFAPVMVMLDPTGAALLLREVIDGTDWASNAGVEAKHSQELIARRQAREVNLEL